MKRLVLAFGAVVLLSLGICGLILTLRVQHQATAMRRFIASGPSSLAGEEAAARQAGIALNTPLERNPLLPPAQNAAPLLTDLTNVLTKNPMILPVYGGGMDVFHHYRPQQISETQKILARRQDVMTLVHRAAGRSGCDFARDWSQGINLKFPEYQKMREATRLLKTESYLQAQAGDYRGAVKNQALGFRVTQNAASDHILISFLVGTARADGTLSGMQSVLIQAGPNAAVDAQVGEIVSRLTPQLSLHAAMAGKTGRNCLLFTKMHQSEQYGVSASLNACGLDETAARPIQISSEEKRNPHALIDAWEADYLAHMTPLVQACDKPRVVRRQAFSAAEKTLDRESRDSAGMTHLLKGIMAPVFTKIDITQTRTQSREAITPAAAYLLGDKAKTGSYPAVLPPRFTDPFSGKPLGYRREGADGFVVYSAGSEGNFDGGNLGEKTPPTESLFRYPPAPPLP